MRDPFKNPFAETDTARHSIWEMLVTRDIDAFLAADWSQVADDFVEKQAKDFQTQQFAEDPRGAIFATTTLEKIEVEGETALVRKKFDGGLRKADGGFDVMKWQTLYYCRLHEGRWKISGFTGYMPNPMP